MSIPNFPKPDRSNFRPNFEKTIENDTIGVGWNEGVLSDSRPFRLECWAQDQVTHLAYFFSTQGLEEMSKDDFIKLLEREKLLKFTSEQRFLLGKKIKDASGNEMWCINIVVADEDESYVEDYTPLRSYKRGRGNPCK